MSWKNWPYWLKGGLITILIYLLLTIFLIIIFFIFKSQISLIFFQIISLPTTLVNNLFGIYSGHNGIINKIFFTSIIIYFIIGFIIGLIYGKIKKKREVNLKK